MACPRVWCVVVGVREPSEAEWAAGKAAAPGPAMCRQCAACSGAMCVHVHIHEYSTS
jgi:hypothetical protein